MNREPDFYYEKSVRRHAAWLLAVPIVLMIISMSCNRLVHNGAEVEVGVGVPGWDGSVVQVCIRFILYAFLVWLVWLVIRGGVCRVVIQDDILRVESPHRLFGTPFEVALPAIARLVRRERYEAPASYEIHTHAGGGFALPYYAIGFLSYRTVESVFAAIRRLHPKIPIENWALDGKRQPFGYGAAEGSPASDSGDRGTDLAEGR